MFEYIDSCTIRVVEKWHGQSSAQLELVRPSDRARKEQPLSTRRQRHKKGKSLTESDYTGPKPEPNREHSSSRIRIRDRRSAGWFRVENEIVDVFGPMYGAAFIAAYNVISRHATADDQDTDIGLNVICRKTRQGKATLLLNIDRMVEHEILHVEYGDRTTPNHYTLLDIKGGSDENQSNGDGGSDENNKGGSVQNRIKTTTKDSSRRGADAPHRADTYMDRFVANLNQSNTPMSEKHRPRIAKEFKQLIDDFDADKATVNGVVSRMVMRWTDPNKPYELFPIQAWKDLTGRDPKNARAAKDYTRKENGRYHKVGEENGSEYVRVEDRFRLVRTDKESGDQYYLDASKRRVYLD